MRKYILLLPIAILTIWLAACSGNPAKSGCHIKGRTTFKEYQKAYLTDISGNRKDSTAIENGEFYFDIAEDITEPYVAVIHMEASQDPIDWLDMPIAIENGRVEVVLEEYIQTSGTPLNTRIQEFLNALQNCKDGIDAQKGMTTDEIGNLFSQFYRQQILSNKDNAVGKYIFQSYGVHLNESDKEQVKAQMGN